MMGRRTFFPSLRAVDIPWAELRREAVALGVEDKERVIADGLEVPVVRGLLLRAVHRAFGAVDVECHPTARRSRCRVLNQLGVQASRSLVVSLLRQDIRLEPMQRGRERDARIPPLPRRQHPKGGVLCQPLGVVRVLVPS